MIWRKAANTQHWPRWVNAHVHCVPLTNKPWSFYPESFIELTEQNCSFCIRRLGIRPRFLILTSYRPGHAQCQYLCNGLHGLPHWPTSDPSQIQESRQKQMELITWTFLVIKPWGSGYKTPQGLTHTYANASHKEPLTSPSNISICMMGHILDTLFWIYGAYLTQTRSYLQSDYQRRLRKLLFVVV